AIFPATSSTTQPTGGLGLTLPNARAARAIARRIAAISTGPGDPISWPGSRRGYPGRARTPRSATRPGWSTRSGAKTGSESRSLRDAPSAARGPPVLNLQQPPLLCAHLRLVLRIRRCAEGRPGSSRKVGESPPTEGLDILVSCLREHGRRTRPGNR